ncbi:Glycosyl transferase family 2 [Rhodococcoides kroppenstedtii]|uniref:Glycosyl transferase family 2 n=1 Tax=Rhodococcoides kroppenstedtii TaxID=293050 RepID=A0A1I0SZH8_9NOCA|nr:glycosyltransferase [Rhodococcus kroppenstedtii]SFA44880.1 Glycosyl transferase family 2 [Rhodococcus kroppenstedtii]
MPTDSPSRDGAGAVELSVVIPAHNSAAVIESTVTAFADHLVDRITEIVVVENGSTDDTSAVCARLEREWDVERTALRVLHSDKGMGNALRLGILRSRGDKVLLTADDLPFGFDDLAGADEHARRSAVPAPVYIGSKAHPRSEVERGILRATMTLGFATLRRVVLRTRTGDPQGTFLLDGQMARELAPALTEPGFLFTTELDYAVELAGIRPVEVPVRLSDRHHDQPSRVAPADIVAMARGLWQLRSRRRGLREAAGAALRRHTAR